MKVCLRQARILDFDIEARPLSYLGGDYTTREITSIAASFGPSEPVTCWLLGRDDPREMLDDFRALYEMADIVTGHYIRKYDLPNINGALLEYRMPPLSARLTVDTKLDLVPIDGVSLSQESISDMLRTEYRKLHMPQVAWRAANRLEQIELTEKRVITDVRQHQQMRLELVRLRMLQSPKMWSPE